MIDATRQQSQHVARARVCRPHWPAGVCRHHDRHDFVPAPADAPPERTLYASRNALPADFDRIIQLIETGQLDTSPWITHRTPFDDLIGKFPSYTKPETGVIKAIVEVD